MLPGIATEADPNKPLLIDSLTGLRIFAALAVVLSHVGAPPSAGPREQAFFSAGYAGVTVFFVLSGFVLAHNYFDRFRASFSLKLLWSFVVARVARIYPLYLLILVWVSLPGILKGKADMTMWLGHALALQAWDPDVNVAYAFNAPGWSISVEFFLYACFPLLVFLLAPITRKRRATLLALLVVVVGMAVLTRWFVVKGYGSLPVTDPHSAHRWLYRNPLCRLGDFMLGILVARLCASLGATHRMLGRVAIAISIPAIVLLMCSPELSLATSSWDLAYAVPAALLIMGLVLAPTSWIARVLAAPPVVFLGESSFALYLCHVYMLAHISLRAIPPDRWFLVEGLTLFMIVVMAVGLHVTVERPMRVLLRWVIDPQVRRRPLQF